MTGRLLAASIVLLVGCKTDPPTSSSTPAVVKPSITWPKSADTRAASLIGDENAKVIARSPVPVLVPDRHVEQPMLIVDAEYYAFSGKLPNGAHLAIQGTRKAYSYESVKPVKGDRPLRGTDGFISMNEGIRVATWTENGAAYSVDIECSDQKDERCVKEDFVRELTNALIYVGGAGR